jgi:hypothetical protein
MTEILKLGGTESRRPPSHPSSYKHYTQTLETPTRAPVQGSATRQRLVPAAPPQRTPLEVATSTRWSIRSMGEDIAAAREGISLDPSSTRS